MSGSCGDKTKTKMDGRWKIGRENPSLVEERVRWQQPSSRASKNIFIWYHVRVRQRLVTPQFRGMGMGTTNTKWQSKVTQHGSREQKKGS